MNTLLLYVRSYVRTRNNYLFCTLSIKLLLYVKELTSYEVLNSEPSLHQFYILVCFFSSAIFGHVISESQNDMRNKWCKSFVPRNDNDKVMSNFSRDASKRKVFFLTVV